MKKITMKVFLIIILIFIGITVGWLIVSGILSNPRNTVESVMGNDFLPEPIPSCVDSDGGLNDFLKGNISLNGEVVATDYCQSNNNLIEHRCNLNDIYSTDDNALVVIPFSCSYIGSLFGLDLVCRNGACIDLNSEPGYVGEYKIGVLKDASEPCPDKCDVIPVEIKDIPTTNNLIDESNITCTESDAGIDEANKGSVTYMDEVVSTDHCFDRKTLIEGYCMTENITSPTAFNIEIKCSDFNPNSICENGACVTQN
ncbi:MAG: hypothetical protein WCF78_01165 [archaeon]